MKFKKMLSGLVRISFFKTLKINLRYFGIKGVIKLPIIVAKGFRLNRIKGRVVLDKMKVGTIQLGFGCDPGFDTPSLKGVFYNSGTIVVHDNFKVWKGASIKVFNNGVLEVGSTFVNSNTHIICAKKIKIGSDCAISWGCYVMDTDYHPIYVDGVVTNEDKPILIGNRCLICMNSSLLKGSKIPDCSVVAANSVVTKELAEANCVYLGNVVIKHNITW